MKFEKEYAFLGLVGDVLNGKAVRPLPEGISADEIFEIGARQNMAPITFCALNAITPRPASEKWADYQKRFFSDCARSEIQMSEYRKLVQYLCANGVKLLPLKGCVIKELYPVPNLRVMSDVDLLYEGVTPQELAKLMEKAGYSTEELEKNHHDVFHKKPVMSIELHRELIAEESPYRPILENLFSKAVPDDSTPNLYHMKPEDLYIHVIVHAAKHFGITGLGIRPMGDIYVLNRTYQESFHRKYIHERLDSVGLARFEEKLRTLAYAFFGEEQQAPVSETDLAFFFRGGTYGSRNKAWEYLRQGGKSSLGFFFYKTFLPYTEMKKRYPVLKKRPILLPFLWVYRIIDIALHGREKVVRVAKTEIKSDDIAYVTQVMESFGLES